MFSCGVTWLPHINTHTHTHTHTLPQALHLSLALKHNRAGERADSMHPSAHADRWAAFRNKQQRCKALWASRCHIPDWASEDDSAVIEASEYFISYFFDWPTLILSVFLCSYFAYFHSSWSSLFSFDTLNLFFLFLLYFGVFRLPLWFSWFLMLICFLVMHQHTSTVCSSVVSSALSLTSALYAVSQGLVTKSVSDSPVLLNSTISDGSLVCCGWYLKLLAVIFYPTKLLSGPFVSFRLCKDSAVIISRVILWWFLPFYCQNEGGLLPWQQVLYKW